MGRIKAPAPPPPTSRITRSKAATTKDTSILISFDDLVRNGSVLSVGCEIEMLKVVRQAKEWQNKWRISEMERLRISRLISEKDAELKGKDCQIKQARTFVDQEQRARQKAEQERDHYRKQLQGVKELLIADGNKPFNSETLERLKKMDVYGFGPAKPIPLSPRGGMEESIESILDASELSFEDSREGRLDESPLLKTSTMGKRKSHSMGRSSFGRDKMVTTTTVTVGPNGQTVAESIIETIPMDMTLAELQKHRAKSRLSREQAAAVADQGFDENFSTPKELYTPVNHVKRTFSNAGSVPSRPHHFQKKTVVVVERCQPCGKRIKFGKNVLKCQDCAAICHVECKNNVPMPCVANATRTPNAKLGGSCLADFTPLEPPMIPALLDYCVKEVEKRGLGEVGLYRIPGNESEATELLDKFIQLKGAPPRLSGYEIHTVTSCIKKFLRNLKEPIIPLSHWHDFVNAANNPDSTDAESALYQAIMELPRPNRDTLAYMVVHLQAVAQNSGVNKMDVNNLATVMGPTIVGYSSVDPMAILTEADKQKEVMKALIAISSDYWSTFLHNDSPNCRRPLSGGNRYFKPMAFDSPSDHVPMSGGPARRTRSRQMKMPYSGKKSRVAFQSPQI